MNPQAYFDNPVIPDPKFLYVLLDTAERIHDHKGQMTIFKFRVEPVSTKLGGTYLHSTIHHSAKAADLWFGCRQTFRFSCFDAASAVGCWGKIFLVPSRWKDRKYSTVQFVKQTNYDWPRINELEQLMKIGAIPWDAQDADQAKAFVEEAMLKYG